MNGLSFHAFDLGSYDCFHSDSLILSHEQDHETLKLFVSGKLTYENLTLFRRYVNHLFDSEMKNYRIFLIDFSQTERIDSTGFGMLIHMYRTLEKENKDLACLNAPENIQILLQNSPLNIQLICQQKQDYTTQNTLRNWFPW